MFQQIQLSLFNMGNTCVICFSLHTHSISLCFLFLLFKDFFAVFSLSMNCKQTGNVFRLLTYPLQVSCLIECLQVTLSVVVYYLSYSSETETVKSSSIDLLCWSTNFQYRLLRMLLYYIYDFHNLFSHR